MIMFIVLGFVCLYSCYLLYCNSKLKESIALIQERGIGADLELATVEQLLDELQSRPRISYLLLLDESSFNLEKEGFRMASVNTSPKKCLHYLALAMKFSIISMRKSGINVPDLEQICSEVESSIDE